MCLDRLLHLFEFNSQLSSFNHELLNFISQQLRTLLFARFRQSSHQIADAGLCLQQAIIDQYQSLSYERYWD